MKKLYAFALSATLFTPLLVSAQEARINEFHYQNTGTDINERIEIAVETGYNCTDPGGLTVQLYDGNTGGVYANYNVLSGTSTVVAGGTLYVINVPGIQDGESPSGADGIALVCGTNVIQFISYGGAFTASAGPANGVTSINIGVAEPNNASATGSIYYTTGGVYVANITANSSTFGALNPAQVTLPVTIKSFRASIIPAGHLVTWETANEIDINKYSLQWSADGSTFSTKYEVAGASMEGKYSYVMNNMVAGNHYYRLMIHHNNGETEFSNTLKIEDNRANVAATVQILENPVQQDVLRFAVAGFTKAPNVLVIDAIGKTFSYNLSTQGEQRIDISNLAPGTYFLKAQDGIYNKVVRFVK